MFLSALEVGLKRVTGYVLAKSTKKALYYLT